MKNKEKKRKEKKRKEKKGKVFKIFLNKDEIKSDKKHKNADFFYIKKQERVFYDRTVTKYCLR